MSDAEKSAAFDALATALTNQWSDGKWSWWCPTPAGSGETKRETREEAVADLVVWAERMAKRDAARFKLADACREAGRQYAESIEKTTDDTGGTHPVSASQVPGQ